MQNGKRYTIKIFISCILSLFFIVGVTTNHFAQKQVSESQLASKYYNEGDYEKAQVLYEKLFNKSKSKVYFRYYLQCLVELKDYSSAEKVVKKQMRRYKNDLTYLVELGWLYKKQGEKDKAEKQYTEAYKKLDANKSQVIQLANTFLTKREYEFAEKVYLKGREIMHGENFHMELASIYAYQRNYEKMMDEYLDILLKSQSQLNNVQNRIQYYIVNDFNDDIKQLLKQKLIKRIQEYTDLTVYSEFLIWLYIQEHDFEQALLQAKALDRRFNEKGKRVQSLASLALTNSDYEIASEAYNYIIDIGGSSPYYSLARMGLLDVYFQKVKYGRIQSEEEIRKIETYYFSTIQDIGRSVQTVKVLMDLAELQGFYMNKPKEALDLLESALEIKGLPEKLQAECKIKMADIMIVLGDMASATLTYTEVEMLNKHNPLGHEAKFKKAKLAYYSGDFYWAQAQLDILKASTSKLIANDAFELAFLISNNTLMDTTEVPLQMYANADLLQLRNQNTESLELLDSLLAKYQSHSLKDEVWYKKGQIMEKTRNFDKALEFYTKIITNYSYDILADNALFKIAQIYDRTLKDTEKAKQNYKKLLVDYPGSIFVIEARKRYRELRGDFNEKETGNKILNQSDDL